MGTLLRPLWLCGAKPNANSTFHRLAIPTALLGVPPLMRMIWSTVRQPGHSTPSSYLPPAPLPGFMNILVWSASFQNQAIESPGVYRYHPVLVRAGAARPFDATGPRDATGRSLSSFHFQIAEHEPVDSLRSLSGSRFSAIEHGVPTDPRLADKYYEVWPNEPLNPNRAHLLVTTYYEASSPRTTGGHEYVKLIVEDPVSAVGAHPGFFDFDDHQYLADGFDPAIKGASASNCEEHETTHYSFFIEQTDGTYLQTGPVVTAEWWNTHPDDFNKEPNSYAMTEAELASGAPTHWTSICDLEDLAYDTEFRVPERHIRRVICRFLVYPAAWNPTAESWNDKFAAKFTDTIGAIKNVYDAITGWFSAMLGIGGQAPSWAGETAAEFTCVGVSAVEHLTSSAIAEPAPNTIAADGSVVPNRVAQGKRDAADMCRRLSNPPVSSCESPSDILLSDGRCMPSPELVLSISPNSSDHMFVSPAPVVRTTGYPLDPDADPDGGPQGSSRVTFTTVLSQRVSPDRYDVGLTDLQVNFDFAWSSVASEYYSGVHGYIVGVRADAEVVGPNNREWETYVLPPRVAEFVSCPPLGGIPDEVLSNTVHSVVMHPVESFSFGSLRRGHRSPHGYEPFFVPSLPYQIARFGEPGYDRNFYADFVRPGTVPDYCYWGASPVGGPRTLVDYRRLAEDLARMPLAPGYDHEFVVAPYVEGVALDSYVGGPVSPIFTIRGGEAACLAVDFADPDPSNFIGVPSGLDAAASFYSHLDQQYGCSERVLASYRPDTSVPDSFRLGFLGLASSDLCGDIFSTNPPAMTWANPVVIQVWALMWILAGSVFFILLLWEALKMTYDVWLEPRPATGFREMVPRFLLALALAAGSFYLCKWILVLTGDFTCFVAQTTGMSLWGVVKETFLVVIDGFLVAHDNIITDQHWLGSTTDTVKRFMTVFSTAFVTLVILIILLILFVKVGLAMILRLALLAVLVAFSPLAFAFFASESTAHWTKKWFSMFMGSVAQQAVVLLVIYIGAHLIGRYLERAGDDFAVFIIGALLGVATLVLADSVPKIVNPASQGLFQSLGSVVSMGAAGAIMAVTAGAGALAGAVRGPGRPPTGTIGSGGGGGGDSDGGSSPGGSSSGGSSSGSSTGAIGSGGGGAGGGGGGGGFRSAIAGSALGAGVYGGLRGLRAASRPLQHVGQGAYQGLQSGMARGGQYNTGMRDLYTGSFLNRHGSTGDDAASRMESLEDTIRDTLPPRGRGG